MPLVTRRGEEYPSFSSASPRPRLAIRRQQRRRRPHEIIISRQALIIVAALAVSHSLNFPRFGTAADVAPIIQRIPGRRGRGRDRLRPFGTIMAPKASSEMADSSAAGNSEASALRELKETVKAQAKEIASLQKELASIQKTDGAPKKAAEKKKKAPAGGHGAHGGGGGDMEEEIHDYLDRPFLRLAQHRVGWLSLFLASLSLTAIIMNGFEHTLSRQIELAYFVPLLAGHGGNTGGQTVGTVLAAMSSGVVGPKDAARVIGKEAASGMSMGIVLGILVSSVARFVMGVSSHVSTVVLFTIPLVSTIASSLASALPFLCVALGLDPTVIAAPAMTSFVDVSGLLSYFLIAQAVFKVFGLEL